MCKVTKKRDNIYFYVIISTLDMLKKEGVSKIQWSNYHTVF